MGQKINPKIFRLGVFNNDWKLKYIENKISESSSIFFKALQIKNYIKRILRFHGLRLHDYIIDLSSTSMNLKISYTISQYSIFFLDKKQQKKAIAFKREKKLMPKNALMRCLLSLKSNKKYIFASSNSNESCIIPVTFIIKLVISIIPIFLKNKLTLLNLLLTAKKKQIYIKKYTVVLELKKHNAIFTKKKLGCYFILYYLSKKNKKNKKNLRFFFVKLKYFQMKVRYTKIRSKRNMQILLGFSKYATGIMIKKVLSLLKNRRLIKKIFFLVVFLNFNKHLDHLQKNLNQATCSRKQQKIYRHYKKKKSFLSSSIRKKRRYKLRQRHSPFISHRLHNNENRSRLLLSLSRRLDEVIFYSDSKKVNIRKNKRLHSPKKKIIHRAKTKLLVPIYFSSDTKKQNNQKFYKNTKTTKIYNFTEYLINNLKSVTGKKSYSIFLTFQQLGTASMITSLPLKKNTQASLKKKIFELNKYKRNDFFEDSIITVLIVITKTCSAQFLADYISSKLPRLVKKHRFFLRFIKKIFKLFIKINFSKINGIKITLRGRVDKKSRKQITKVLVGNMGLQELKSEISHAKATSVTRDGTLGTEVWVNYKKFQKLLIY